MGLFTDERIPKPQIYTHPTILHLCMLPASLMLSSLLREPSIVSLIVVCALRLINKSALRRTVAVRCRELF